MYTEYYDIYPIKDIENVDERRKLVGLPPLLYNKIIYGNKILNEYTLSEEQLYKELLRVFEV